MQKIQKLSYFFCASLLLLSQAIAASPSLASSPASSPVTGKSTPAHAGGLRRLDFRLEGVSCARCILNVRSALRASKGVSRVEIALRKPYGGVLIFDSNLTNADKLVSVATTADKNTQVQVKDLLEAPVKAVPAVLIPKYTALQKAGE